MLSGSYILVVLNLIIVTFSKISSAENFIKLTQSNISKNYVEPKSDLILEDTKTIVHAIGMFVRPEFDKYPYISVEDKEQGIFKYIEPEIGLEILITIPNLSLDSELKIFPLGDHEFGYPMKQTYVVLRKKNTKDSNDKQNQAHYYINLAYVRPQSKLPTLVEWSIINTKVFNRNRLQENTCRGKECKVPDFIFGTCKIVSNKVCPQQSEQPNGNILSKWTWKANLGNFQSRKVEETQSNTNNNNNETPEEPRALPSTSPEKEANPAEIVREKREPAESSESAKSDAVKVPNSLDLLMLKRSDKEAEIGEGHYPNSLLDVRQVKASEFESVLDSECIECEKNGEFFDDFEEEPEFSKTLGNFLKQMPTLKVPQQEDLSSAIPFLGYGHCNFSQDAEKINQLIQSNEIEDIVGFIQNTLKLGCDEQWENRIRAMFTSRFKILDTSDGFSIDVSPSSLFPKYKILTPKELETLMTALVLTQYTRLYREEVAESIKEVDSVSITISKRTRFLTKLILRLIESFSKRFSQHLIKGLRVVLRLVKDKFLSLLVQEDTNEAEGLSHDKYQIMALKEFILYGLGPSSKSRTGIEESFRSFYTVNENRIRSLVKAYE